MKIFIDRRSIFFIGFFIFSVIYHKSAFSVTWDAHLDSVNRDLVEVVVETEIYLYSVQFQVSIFGSRGELLGTPWFSFTDGDVNVLEAGFIHRKRFKHGLSNAYSANGNSLTYSEVSGGKQDNFTKRIDVYPFPMPKQISPPNNTVFNHYPRSTTLKWTGFWGAKTYYLEIDCFQCCKTGKWCSEVGKKYLNIGGLKSTSYTFNFVGAQPGRWRVCTVGERGDRSPMTSWWYFKYTK